MTSPTSGPLRRAALAARTLIVDLIVPSAITAEWHNRRLHKPTLTTVDSDIASRMKTLGTDLDGLKNEQRELVLLVVSQERERTAGLESKAFAAVGLPLALVTLAVLVLPQHSWATIIASLSILYAVSALIPAVLVLRPRVRAVLTIDRASDADALARLVAVSQVNQDIGIAIQNRVWASLADTLRSAVLLLAAAVIVAAASGRPSSIPAQPTGATLSTSTRSGTATSLSAATTGAAPSGPTATTTSATGSSRPQPTESTSPSASASP